MLRDGWQVTSELGAAGAYRREQRRGRAGEQIHEAVDILVHWTVGASSGGLFVCFSMLKIESSCVQGK